MKIIKTIIIRQYIKRIILIMILCLLSFLGYTQNCNVFLQVAFNPKDSCGYQLLIDTLTKKNLITSGNYDINNDSIYLSFKYKIPYNAKANDTSVVKGLSSDSIYIKPGNYYYMILNPSFNKYGKNYIPSNQFKEPTGIIKIKENTAYVFTIDIFLKHDFVDIAEESIPFKPKSTISTKPNKTLTLKDKSIHNNNNPFETTGNYLKKSGELKNTKLVVGAIGTAATTSLILGALACQKKSIETKVGHRKPHRYHQASNTHRYHQASIALYTLSGIVGLATGITVLTLEVKSNKYLKSAGTTLSKIEIKNNGVVFNF